MARTRVVARYTQRAYSRDMLHCSRPPYHHPFDSSMRTITVLRAFPPRLTQSVLFEFLLGPGRPDLVELKRMQEARRRYGSHDRLTP